MLQWKVEMNVSNNRTSPEGAKHAKEQINFLVFLFSVLNWKCRSNILCWNLRFAWKTFLPCFFWYVWKDNCWDCTKIYMKLHEEFHVIHIWSWIEITNRNLQNYSKFYSIIDVKKIWKCFEKIREKNIYYLFNVLGCLKNLAVRCKNTILWFIFSKINISIFSSQRFSKLCIPSLNLKAGRVAKSVFHLALPHYLMEHVFLS